LYGDSSIFAWGKVVGDYYFRNEKDGEKDYQKYWLKLHKWNEHYGHRKKVKWQTLFSPFPVDNLPKEIAKKLKGQNTIKEFTEDWPIIKKHIDKHLKNNPNINCGLSCEPKNEQQVIALFARYFEALGFSKMWSFYNRRHTSPDAEALTKNNKHVLIEFEHKSSGAKTHGENLNKWDYLICWEHDWKKIPYKIKVIELKKELSKKLK